METNNINSFGTLTPRETAIQKQAFYAGTYSASWFVFCGRRNNFTSPYAGPTEIIDAAYAEYARVVISEPFHQRRRIRAYVRGWFTPTRIERIGNAGIALCVAAGLYMAVTQFAVGCGLLP